MKKIMLAAVVALGIAGLTRASSYYWGVTSDASLNGYAGDTVYVLLASDWSSTITADQVVNKALDNADMTKKLNKTGVASRYFSYGANDKDGETLSVVFVDINASGQYFKWEDTLTSTASTSSDKTYNTVSSSDFATHASGGYQPFPGSPVPEPTSGFLLLLGVAGLALRRKRA